MNLRIAAAAAILSALSLPAQVQVFGGAGERAASTVIYYDQGTQSLSGMSLQYGQPLWQDAYETQMDQMKGKRARLGKDWWTTFDTSVACELNGVKVPAGSYFLGLECSKDGKWSLLVVESGTAMAHGQMPFVPDSWTVAHTVPMEHGKVDATVEKMTMALQAGKDDPSALSLTLSWGNHQLVAKGKATLGAKPAKGKEAGHDAEHGEHKGEGKKG